MARLTETEKGKGRARRAFSLCLALTLMALVPAVAEARYAIAMSGSFAGKEIRAAQGATGTPGELYVIVFNQGDQSFTARLVPEAPNDVELLVDGTPFTLAPGGTKQVPVTVRAGRYAPVGVYRIAVRAELIAGSGGGVAVVGAVAQEATLEVTSGGAVTFADVAGHWAQADIELMAARGVARGVAEGRFNPDGAVTRAEFAAFLLRALAIPESRPAAGHFGDVPTGAWYYGAVETAYAVGLVQGYGDGSFRPLDRVTREQSAVMIVRALIARGRGAAPGNVEATLAAFSDAGQISSWARQAVATAVAEGIIGGRGNGCYAPRAQATRAEAVVMLRRMLGCLGLLVV